MLYFKSLAVGIAASVLGGLVSVVVFAAILIRRSPFPPSQAYSFDPRLFLSTPIYLSIAVSFLIGFTLAYRLMR